MLAAAICQAGIGALPEGIPALKGLPLRLCSDATASVPAALLTEAGLGTVLSLAVLLLAVEVLALETFDDELAPGVREKVLGVGADVAGGFIRWPMSIFKLFSSALSSRSRLSVFSFWASIALGIRSLSPLTSSVVR